MKLVSAGSINPNTVGLSEGSVLAFHAIIYGNIGMCRDYPKNCVNLQAGVELRNISLEVYEYVEKEPDS